MRQLFSVLALFILVQFHMQAQKFSYDLKEPFAKSQTYRGIAFEDFNNDTFDDIVLVDRDNNEVEIYLNKGSGVFSESADHVYSYSRLLSRCVVANFDDDTNPDIAVIEYDRKSVSVLLSNGDGSFTVKGSTDSTNEEDPEYIVALNANGDTYMDIALSNTRAGTCTVYINNGDGTFKTPVVYPSSSTPSHITNGDYNNDGFADIVVGNGGTNEFTVHLNDGNGGFSQSEKLNVLNSAGHNVIVEDLDGNNLNDLAIAISNYDTDALRIYKGQQGGGYSESSILDFAEYPYGIHVVNYIGNHAPDIILSDRMGVYFLLNDGVGNFTQYDSIGLDTYFHNDLGVRDLNNDDRYDIVLTGDNDARVYLSTGGPTGTTPTKSIVSFITLYQNYPNPVHSETSFSFDVHRTGWVTLALYSLDGRKVMEVFNGNITAGKQHFLADLRNLNPGVYVYRITLGAEMVQNLLTVVR